MLDAAYYSGKEKDLRSKPAGDTVPTYFCAPQKKSSQGLKEHRCFKRCGWSPGNGDLGWGGDKEVILALGERNLSPAKKHTKNCHPKITALTTYTQLPARPHKDRTIIPAMDDSNAWKCGQVENTKESMPPWLSQRLCTWDTGMGMPTG